MISMPATISYNDYSFSAAARSRIRSRFVYDGSQRTVAYTVFAIEVNDIVANTTGTDASMLDVRRKLSKAGQQLRYEGVGFGTNGLKVNVDNVKDVVWGPKVKTCEMESIGFTACWRIIWAVEVAIPDCQGARFENAVLAFNYALDYAIDHQGFTTRTYRGYVQSPMTRLNGGRTVLRSADDYRERIKPPLVEGFYRDRQDFTLSDDRTRLDFTIADKEKPVGALPEGCVKADGTHTITSENNNTYSYITRISANYTLSPKKPKVFALQAFNALVQDRFGVTTGAAQQGQGNIAQANNFFNNVLGQFAPGNLAGPIGVAFQQVQQAFNQQTVTCYLSAFRASEGLYESSNQVSFEVEGWIKGFSIQSIIPNSGMWRAVPNTDWNRWRMSVEDVLGVRGAAGLKFDPASDILIDLCLGEGTVTSQVANAGRIQSGTPSTTSSRRQVLDGSKTWLAYKCQVKIPQVTGIVAHKALPKEKPQERTLGTAAANAALITAQSGIAASANLQRFLGNTINSLQPTDPNNVLDVITQRRLTPFYKVILSGYAARVGLKASVPELVSVGGAKAKPLRGTPSLETIGNISGLPIYLTKWVTEYVLESPPTQQPIPAPIDPAKEVPG